MYVCIEFDPREISTVPCKDNIGHGCYRYMCSDGSRDWLKNLHNRGVSRTAAAVSGVPAAFHFSVQFRGAAGLTRASVCARAQAPYRCTRPG